MPVHDWTRVEPGIFHNFHVQWLVRIYDALNEGVLPEDYYALAEQDAGPGLPDVLALRLETAPLPTGGTALAQAVPRVWFRDRADRERKPRAKSRHITIRHVTGDVIVAFIEIVSPGSKSSRGAIRQFVTKTTSLIEAGIHLLVLDLFPPSSRDPQGLHPLIWSPFHKSPFKLPTGKPLTIASYCAGAIAEAFVEPVAVGDRLPKMPLFLTPEEYVRVPLEASYQAACNAVPKRWRNEILAAP
jgi:hypothetical protein